MIGIAAVILLIALADIQQVWVGILDFGLKHLMIVCGIQVLTLLMISMQWKMIAKQMGEKISFGSVLGINLSGTFVESITPAVKAGGEAAKVMLFKSKLNISAGKAVAIVGVQKTLTSTVFTILCTISMILFILQVKMSVAYRNVLGMGFLFLLLTVGLLLLAIIAPQKVKTFFLKRKILKKFHQSIGDFFNHFEQTIQGLKSQKQTLIIHFILSMAIWLLFPVKAYYIAVIIGLDISFFAIAMVTYLTYMIGMIPLLPGGLGSFEAAAVFLLQPLGVSLEAGMVLALVLRFATFWFVFGLSSFYLLSKFFVDVYGKIIPNTLTLANLCLGVAAILYIGSNGVSYWPAIFILIASLMDMLDGKLARKLDACSEIGKQLDSLCDLVTFGIAPMVLLWHSALYKWNAIGAMIVFVYIACGAYRLARYNVAKDTSFFMGMPITLGGILSTLWYVSPYYEMPIVTSLWVIMLSIAMISRVKFKRIDDFKVFNQLREEMIYRQYKRLAKKESRK